MAHKVEKQRQGIQSIEVGTRSRFRSHRPDDRRDYITWSHRPLCHGLGHPSGKKHQRNRHVTLNETRPQE